jgi:hypothetical protein
MLKTYINKINKPTTESYVTIFYAHSYGEGFFVEGEHDNLPVNTSIYKNSESSKKGIIVIPTNDPAYYAPHEYHGDDYNPVYYFAGSGDYPNPLKEFTYYKVGSKESIPFPQKLIDLLKQNYDE